MASSTSFHGILLTDNNKRQYGKTYNISRITWKHTLPSSAPSSHSSHTHSYPPLLFHPGATKIDTSRYCLRQTPACHIDIPSTYRLGSGVRLGCSSPGIVQASSAGRSGTPYRLVDRHARRRGFPQHQFGAEPGTLSCICEVDGWEGRRVGAGEVGSGRVVCHHGGYERRRELLLFFYCCCKIADKGWGKNVKYGVISTRTLEKDLKEWTTFYLSGRLHKPVLTLLPPPSSLSSALRTNSHSALSLALLLLPPSFTEDALWEQIAGLSYSGDPRMSVPGAENPEKVKNIVKGEGAREGFRKVYGGLLRRLGISWEGEENGDKNEWEWKGNGEEMMVVSIHTILPQGQKLTGTM